MKATALELVGVLVGSAGAAAALLAIDPRRRYAALGVALVAAAALLAGEVAGEGRFDDLLAEPAAIVLGVVLGALALGATAATFLRVPAAFAIAAFVVLPLRVPLQFGGETNFLLVPLYGVIAGGFARAAWVCLRRDPSELQTRSSPAPTEPRAIRWLAVALAASLVVYAVGVAWTEDPENAIRTVAFFLVPFAGMLVLLRDIDWHRKLVGQVLLAITLTALAFAAIAVYQYLTRSLSINTDLVDANELHLYFRVNSLFRDPNVLGRYLAFAIIALAAWIAWRRSSTHALAGTLVAAFLLVALTFTYSQTSYAALVVGLGALAAFRLGARGVAVAVGLGLTALAAAALLGGPPKDTSVDSERTDLAETSSGRTNLITGGIDLWLDQPVVGQGSGEFAVAYRRKVDRIPRPVSHTEPVTVAAEQGLLGLVPYAATVVLSLLVFLRPWPSGPARAGVAAIYIALLVHTLGYAGYAIDPATWGLIALGIVLARLETGPAP